MPERADDPKSVLDLPAIRRPSPRPPGPDIDFELASKVIDQMGRDTRAEIEKLSEPTAEMKIMQVALGLFAFLGGGLVLVVGTPKVLQEQGANGLLAMWALAVPFTAFGAFYLWSHLTAIARAVGAGCACCRRAVGRALSAGKRWGRVVKAAVRKMRDFARQVD